MKFLKPIVFYTLIAVGIGLFGLIVGVVAVLFPPLFGVALVALPLGLLAWASPDFKSVPEIWLRRAFLLFMAIELCVPAYYAIQLPGLPWISARRGSQVVLIVLFVVVVSGSRQIRARISDILSRNRLLTGCVVGFLVANVASIFTSASPASSISGLSEIVLHWYLPFFACLVVIRDEKQIKSLFTLIALCAVSTSIVGILEFIDKHRFVFDIFPAGMLSKMAEDNKSFAEMLHRNPYRNGLYRASSIFTGPLGYSEFIAMTAPIGLFLIIYSETWQHKLLGYFVLGGAFASFFVSGARGGMIAVLLAIPVLMALAVARNSRMHPKSMLGPLGVLLLLTGVVAGAGAVEFNGRLHNTILGGGDTQSSNEGRVVEWNMAEPHILANPVTGHGLNMGAEVVGFVTPGGNLTLDSYVISLLVECGIPGLLAFFGMVALGFAKGALRYLLDSTVAGPLCGALSCGVLAYGINRLVLSQRENQSLFFIYIALLVLLTLRDRGPSSGRRERARATTRKPNVEVVYDA